jgi:hypothetical protein
MGLRLFMLIQMVFMQNILIPKTSNQREQHYSKTKKAGTESINGKPFIWFKIKLCDRVSKQDLKSHQEPKTNFPPLILYIIRVITS